MNKAVALSDLELGQTACVSRICAEGAIKRRLLDIGLINGTSVKCICQSPTGDPKAFLIRGAVIAIRREDAEKIFIKWD